MLARKFSEEQNLFRDSVSAFVAKEVAPYTLDWRDAGITPKDIYKKAGEQGYLCIWADEKHGGLAEPDFRFEQIFMEELASIGENGFLPFLHSRLVAPYIDNFGSEFLKDKYLPGCVSGDILLGIAMTEPNTGSDLAAISTKAEDKGDHYLLNGSKTFITNGINGDLFVVAARTGSDSKYAISLFLVEAQSAGFVRGKKLKKIGMPSQDTAELFFDNIKVPKENLLGELNKGFYHMMQGLAEERLLCAIGCLGGAQAAFATTLDYVKQRKAFGKPIGQFQNTQFEMASMSAELDMAQVYVDHCVVSLNQGKLTGEDAAKAKLLMSEIQGRTVDQCVQFHGGNGYMQEYLISRLYVDARVMRIFAGTSEIMRTIIAGSLGLK